MLLPQLAFTDSIPTTLTWPMTGGATAGGDTAVEFVPYEHAMLGSALAGADIVAVSENNYAVLGSATLGASSTVEFVTPTTLEHVMTGGLSAGAPFTLEFEGTVILGLSAGASTTVEFVEPTVHDLSDDFIPNGGIVWGGSAIISENIPHVPSGGVVWGGSAIVQENIPFTASGGIVWGGTSPVTIVFSHVPEGGVVWGGAAAVSAVFTHTPEGGVVWGGSAPVTTYSAWHAPSGGIVWGGSAIAYAVVADYVATPENPYSQPFYGWSMNAENGAVTRYYRFPATSMCQFAGRTFVTTAAGVYEYGAEDDAGIGIRASVQFPKTDFQTTLSKRMSDAYLGLKTTGRMRLKLVVNDDDPRYYPIIPSGDSVKGARVNIGKGLKGRYWTARLDNVAGADFELDSATFLPIKSERRHGA